jgi:DNA-binding transcriptional regulator PaaX
MDPMEHTTDGRWLLLIHQIPPKPGYLRVKAWRRLQRLGAVALKNSVYVLPKSEQAHVRIPPIVTTCSAPS